MSTTAGSKAETTISSEDIRRLCGDVPDWKVAAIFALAPTAGDVELAVMWADNQDEAPQLRSLEGDAARVFDILAADEEEDER